MVLRGVAEILRWTQTAAVGALLGFGPLRNNSGMQAAKADYWIRNAYDVKLVKVTEPKELRFEKAAEMCTYSQTAEQPL